MAIDRSRGSRSVVLVLAGLLAVAVPTGADEQTSYSIQLSRPSAVGRKHEISAEGAIVRKTVVTLAGVRKEQPQTGEGIKLEAQVEVLAVTLKGRVSKLSITV